MCKFDLVLSCTNGRASEERTGIGEARKGTDDAEVDSKVVRVADSSGNVIAYTRLPSKRLETNSRAEDLLAGTCGQPRWEVPGYLGKAPDQGGRSPR